MILTVGSGYIYTLVYKNAYWGWIIGVFISFIGTSLGSILGFLMSRFLLRSYIKKIWKNNKRFKAIENAI